MNGEDVLSTGNLANNDSVHHFTSNLEHHSQTLRASVETALENYFAQLDGQPVINLYDLVLSEVEAPLLESVLRITGNNQTKCARMLGLNRGTLRKKLKKYGFI
ncbi:MAG: DNA-binding transcriptional regulator Fis [Pseudomonadales bacterium]|jgi:Fis family transcriptional regulator|nr:DNA-binding transcriptional regulator Fis [Pseudomonadales bacterium]MDP7594505.1 DNA-binding transcriptional regulator Fis [Pseudomonadales bacterium]HJN52715.1 DNA-binding transcriptional regulator Fis [Pseudomonadales bacterium]|tara:strand:- start:12617 stop:12928 length:312 start_codon:yes stop_codon:yes gene_type:complete